MEERIGKLEKEVEKLKGDLSKVSRLERIVRLLTMLGAVCVFAWGLYEHFDAIEQEFRKTFWQEQYALYSQATEAASTISIADHLDSVRQERYDFWKLYWGRLSIVESRSVFDAMVKYGAELSRLEACPSCPRGFNELGRLRKLSYELARACRESLKRTWEPAVLDDIPDGTSSRDADVNR